MSSFPQPKPKTTFSCGYSNDCRDPKSRYDLQTEVKSKFQTLDSSVYRINFNVFDDKNLMIYFAFFHFNVKLHNV